MSDTGDGITRAAYQGDIVSRLRNWRGQHLSQSGELFEDAATEIAHLRLTDAEREAVERAAQWMVQLAKDRGEIHSAGYFVDDAATLRGLLERTGVTEAMPKEKRA